jgi:hypothetical protein
MNLSHFVLALYVLLESFVYLKFVSVDPKLIGVIGVAFVVILIIETVYGRGLLPARR